MSDAWCGLLLFLASLLLLTGCLVLLVRVLGSLLRGPAADLARAALASDLPCCPWLTGWLVMGAGAAVTFLLQSSSVFTSTLTPLAKYLDSLRPIPCNEKFQEG